MKPTVLTISLIVLAALAADTYRSCSSPVIAQSGDGAVIEPPLYPPASPTISVKRTTLRNGDELWIFASHSYATAIRTGPESIERVACWHALPDSPYRKTDVCPGTFVAPSRMHPVDRFLLDARPCDPLAGIAVRGVIAELRGYRGKEAGVSRVAFLFDASPPDK